MAPSATSGVVPAAERSAHMGKVRDRLAEGRQRLEERAAKLRARTDLAALNRLLHQAIVSKSQAQRVLWLRREADALGAAAAGLTACDSGCSHCCHIGLVVAEPEAIAIGRAIGRAPAEPAADRTVRASELYEEATRDAARSDFDARYFGVPCTFLVDGHCSIYENRPLACRRLFNMDQDDLLCRLVPDEPVEVPYIDTRRQQAAYLFAMGQHSRLADLRDWFPAA